MNAAQFVTESNRIEGILRPPTAAELMEFKHFMALEKVNLGNLIQFVSVYQPDARLRVHPGMNVRVGLHVPPPGGPAIVDALNEILTRARRKQPNHCHEIHLAYESLHPFTDGNGRSGRMLWAWQLRNFPLGFLHHFYYQTLAANSPRP